MPKDFTAYRTPLPVMVSETLATLITRKQVRSRRLSCEQLQSYSISASPRNEQGYILKFGSDFD